MKFGFVACFVEERKQNKLFIEYLSWIRITLIFLVLKLGYDMYEVNKSLYQK